MNLDHHLARMDKAPEPTGPRTYLGHDPSLDIPGFEGQGIDLLVTVWAATYDQPERMEIATRPGHSQQWLTWGVPIHLGATL